MAGSGMEHLRNPSEVLIRVENLVMEFPVGKTGLKVHAVSDVSIDAKAGETLGLVGESGCGKSTTGKAIMQLPRPTSGRVLYAGTDLTKLSGPDLRQTRPEMQMIFQDPISSLNPRRRVSEIVSEPLWIWANNRNPPGPKAVLARTMLLGVAGIWALLGVVAVLLGPAVLGDDAEVPARVLAFLNAAIEASVVFAIAQMAGSRNRKSPIAASVYAAWSLFRLLLLIAFGGGLTVWTSLIGAATLAAIVAAALVVSSRTEINALSEHIDAKVRQALEDVGIDPEAAWNRRPHEFSGGQCQRICIARSLVLDPKVIICDEPVSALDVSVQAQILNLLEDMKARYNLTLVFIAHDLAVVKNVSDRVAVMYLGKMCEVAPPDDLYANPAHPYTAALLSSIPVPDPRLKPTDENVLGGEIPSPIAPPSGCRFRTRCPRAQDMCAQVEPKMRQIGFGHYVACHFPLDSTGPKPGAAQLAANRAARVAPQRVAMPKAPGAQSF